MRIAASLLAVAALLAIAPALALADPAPAQQPAANNDPPPPARHCVRDTGTRLAGRDADGCNGEPGRSFGHDELDSTGEANVGEALQRLDPSVTIRR